MGVNKTRPLVMRYILIFCCLMSLNYKVRAQGILSSETFKIHNIRVVLTLEAVNEVSSFLNISISNRNVRPIYFDTSYFNVLVSKTDSSKSQIFGSSFIGTHPMNLIELGAFKTYSMKIPLIEFNMDLGIDGQLHFISKKSLNGFCRDNKLSVEKCNPHTALIDFYSSRIYFKELRPQMEWTWTVP